MKIVQTFILSAVIIVFINGLTFAQSPPSCNVPVDTTYFVCGNTTFNFSVSADADNAPVVCTMPSGDGSFDGSTWSFTTTGAGDYSAVFRCEDTINDTCVDSTTITVNYNSAPSCNIPNDTAFFICADSSFSFAISATDTDGNLDSCALLSGDGSFDGSDWIFTTSGTDTFTAVFECVDSCGATCTDTVEIAVTVNSSPSCNLPADTSYFLSQDTIFNLSISATDTDNNLDSCAKLTGAGSFDGSTWIFTTSGEGVYTGIFKCVDSCGATCTDTVDITVSLNSPPVCNLPSDTSFFVCADTSFSFAVSATDVDGNLDSCVLLSGDGSFNGSDWTFTTTGSGEYIGVFECVDSMGATCGDTVNITVTVNSAPVCEVPNDTTYFFNQDTTFNLSISATDTDNNLDSCAKLTGAGSFDGSTWIFTTSGEGVYTGVFKCVDSCGATCTDTVDITVSLNSPPVCNLPPDTSFFVCADTSFSFAVSATDVDGNLDSCVLLSGEGSFDGSDWTFTTTGSGEYIGVFECVDSMGATCGDTVNITVTVNSAPVCEVPNDTTYFFNQDTTFNFAISATDTDNNLDSCAKLFGAGTFDGSTWIFTTSGEGVYTGIFECVDSCGATCTDTVDITVSLNSPPVCNLPSDTSFFVCADTSFSFAVSATDVDGNLESCALLSGDGSFDGSDWTFTTTGSGEYIGVFECVDSMGATCGDTVNITVTVNSVPVCEVPNDTTYFFNQDTTFNFAISATDTDNNLDSCAKLSGAGTFDGSTWIFTTSGEGVYTGIFECVDSCGAICTDTVDITVSLNSPPVCNLPVDTSFFVCNDTSFIFAVSATDVDGNLESCALLSGDGSFDGSDWTFTTTGSGEYIGVFECVDSMGATCGDTVNITVTVNSVPVCEVPNDTTYFFNQDTTFNFSISATDTDNNLDSCVKLSGAGTFDGSTWTFTTSGESTYRGIFECVDSCGATCTDTVDITVSLNSPPVCNLPVDTSFFVCNDTSFIFAVSATDVDGNLESCALLSGDGSFDGSDWTFTTSGSGEYIGVFECVDSLGATCGDTVDITVSINAPPVCSLPPDSSFFVCGDTTFIFPVGITDIDGNLVSCVKISGPGSYDGGNWTFTTSDPGLYSAEFLCQDSCGATCGGTVNISVTYNSPPIINTGNHPPWTFNIWNGDVFVDLSLVSGNNGYAYDLEGDYPLFWWRPDSILSANPIEISRVDAADSLFAINIKSGYEDTSYSLQLNFLCRDTGRCISQSSLPLRFTQLELNLPENDFGQALIDYGDSIEFSIINPGPFTIAGPRFDSSGAVNVTVKRKGGGNPEADIPANSALAYYAVWQPTEAGQTPGEIIITSSSVAGSAVIGLTGTASSFALVPEVAEINFGYVNYIDSRLAIDSFVSVEVVGDLIAELDSIWLSGSSGYELTEAPDSGLLLEQGASFDLGLRAGGGSLGEYQGIVHIRYFWDQDGQKAPVEIELLSLTAVGEKPQCDIYDEEITYPDIIVGQSETRYLTLANNSNVTSIVDSITFQPYDTIFYLDPVIGLPVYLDPGEMALPIIFAPKTTREYTVTPVIWDLAEGDCAPPLFSGSGISDVWGFDDPLNFGGVSVCGSAAFGSFKITNQIGDEALIDSLRIDHPDWFSFDPPLSSYPGGSILYLNDLSFAGQFIPADTGAPSSDSSFIMTLKYHNVNIPPDTMKTLSFVIAKGAGCAGILSEPGVFDFGPAVELSESVDTSIVLTNIGGCELTVDSVSVSAPFAIIGAKAFTISGDSNYSLGIRYTPRNDDPNPTSAQLMIIHDSYSAPFDRQTDCHMDTSFMTVSAFWQDSRKPEIDQVVPPSSDTSRTIQIYVSDAGTGVDTVTVRWRLGNAYATDAGRKPAVQPLREDDYWSFRLDRVELPEDSLYACGYEIKVIASDINGNNTASDWISIPGNFPAGHHTISQSAWLDGSAGDSLWHMAAIPGNLDVGTVGMIFNTRAGLPASTGDNDDEWRILEHTSNQGSDRLSQIFAADLIEPDRAYFFRHINRQFTLSLPSGSTVPTDTPHEIRLEKGWNLIASPFLFPIEVEQSDFPYHVSSLIHARPTEPGEQFDYEIVIDSSLSSGRLEPWVGYAIYCHADAGRTILIDPHFNQYESPPPSGPENMYLSLKLIAAGKPSGRMMLGVNENSVDGPDIYDLVEFDMFHADQNLFTGDAPDGCRFLRDIRNASVLNIWDLHIDPENSPNLRLEWTPVHLPLDEMVLVLRDAVMGRVIDMAKRDHYDIPGPSQLPFGRFKVYYGLKVEVEAECGQAVTIIPDRFQLYQNYPNPFNPETFISFDLPREARVNLEIFNILGARVATLVDERVTAGSYRVRWDGRDGENNTVAAGVYFARLRAAEYTRAIKLVLIK